MPKSAGVDVGIMKLVGQSVRLVAHFSQAKSRTAQSVPSEVHVSSDTCTSDQLLSTVLLNKHFVKVINA